MMNSIETSLLFGALGQLKANLENRGSEYASKFSQIADRLRECEGVPDDVLNEIDLLTREVKAGTEIVSLLFCVGEKAIEQLALMLHPMSSEASDS